MNSQRLARISYESKERRQYEPSTSELLLEEMCRSFGTELLEAYINIINRTMLVRIANPVRITNPNGVEKTLQFQLARFCPADHRRAREIFQKNLGKPSKADTIRIGQEREGNWDSFRAVTDQYYLEHLGVHRWPKEIYVAVYEEKYSPDPKLFWIHEQREQVGAPRLCMKFEIQPYFIIGMSQESDRDIYDQLIITFPQIEIEHQECEKAALDLHPLKYLYLPERGPAFPAFNVAQQYISPLIYDIHSSVPRQTTMGFICAYLRHFLWGKSFY